MTDRSTPWHVCTAGQTLSELVSDPRGLEQLEAERRIIRYGPNHLPTPPSKSAFRRLLAQFHNVLIYVLLVAGAVTLLLGEWVDSAVIFAVVLINTAIGFIQEGKAEQALAAIRNRC